MTEIPKALALWFPLVPRARPICAPLHQRIEKITGMAHQAGTATAAAAALNLTALITSDIGAPELAAEMCWRQFRAFADHAPLESDNVGLAMEPIINLARLAIRDGDGDRAHTILDQALTAATDATTTVIDGYPVDFARLTTDTASRQAARERLWIALLADGTRALTRAGRWTDAHQSNKRRNGIGDRLLYGRQTAIIAHFTADNLTSAISMIAETVAVDPWEQVLAAYFENCCAYANGTTCANTCTGLIEQFHRLDLPMEQSLFQIRLGLSILELAYLLEADTELLVKELEQAVLGTGDAYAAQDLVNNQHFVLLGHNDSLAALAELLTQSGLGTDVLPNLQRQRLRIAADVGLTRLHALLGEAVQS